MIKENYTIRTMTRTEVDMAIEWAAGEGWNPGMHDAGCFYAADPSGFLIGLLGTEPVATLSVVKYGASFAFLGFYIVKPEYRGRGYGIQIWNTGLACLKERTVGLDGVVDQQNNYKKSGFNPAYSNIRYQGRGGGILPAGSGIVPLSSIPFEVISTYDRAFFPDNRTQFLKCWINQPRSAALGIMRNGKLSGYGIVRSCRSGCKIGPLFADSPECAENLFLALKAFVPEGDTLFLDTPEVNPSALDLMKRHNMMVVFETARMYRGTIPDLPVNRIYGVTTFELG